MLTNTSNRLAGMLTWTLALTFVLVVWGGVVRLSGSGLAIPDWPLAEGKLLPRAHPNVLIEYGHRFIAMVVGFSTLAVAIMVFRSPARRGSLVGLTIAALITLALQVFMGGRVVIEELPVDRVVTHLLLAFTFFGILLMMRLRVGEETAPEAVAGPEARAPLDPRARGLARFAHLSAGLVFLQAGLGAWVSSSGAALACPDFPTCQGSWLPPMEGLVGIHYAHRLGPTRWSWSCSGSWSPPPPPAFRAGPGGRFDSPVYSWQPSSCSEWPTCSGACRCPSARRTWGPRSSCSEPS